MPNSDGAATADDRRVRPGRSRDGDPQGRSVRGSEAGSGGLSVAAGASRMGARVVLIERGEMGGDCLNYGCVPSKSLLAAGHAAQTFREAERYALPASNPKSISRACATMCAASSPPSLPTIRRSVSRASASA